VTSAGQVTASVDDVGALLENGADHRDVISRVVLEIGVLNDHVVARGQREACAHGGTLSAVVLQAMQTHPAEATNNLSRPIARAVVDDDHFLAHAESVQIHGGDAFEKRPDEPFLVVGRNHD
jgi:hypothetical protein